MEASHALFLLFAMTPAGDPPVSFDRDVRPQAGKVLQALEEGVKVEMIGRDLARQTPSEPKPNDPRLPSARAKRD